MTTLLNERERYLPDHRLSLAGIPLLFAGSGLAGVAAGWVLAFLFVRGWYFVGIVPIVIALGIGGIMHGIVGWSRCRNPLMAGLVGSLAGSLAFLGYYYFCLQRALMGIPVPIEFLPDYIWHRLETDVLQDAAAPGPGGGRPVVILNTVVALVELACLIGIPWQFASRRARRVYATEQDRWYTQEEVLRAPYQSHEIVEALNQGRLAVALRDAPSNSHPQLATRFIVQWLDTPDSSPLDFPIYASVDDQYETPFMRTLRRVVERPFRLTSQEALTLRAFCPKLAARLDVEHPELQAAPAQLISTTSKAVSPSALAVVTPVSEPYRQRVRSRGYALKVNLIDLIPIVYLFGGLGGMVMGGWLISVEQWVAGAVLIALGAAAVGWGCYAATLCQCVYSNRWINRRLRAEVAQRPDPIVELDDPGTQYVSLIPREAFTKIQLTMASDVLLMALDEKRSEIRLEGDCDRYRIPAEAITDCQAMCFFHPIDPQHTTHLWMVRLLIQRESGEQELLLSVNKIDWSMLTNHRREQAVRATCEQVNALRRSVNKTA